MNRKGVYGCLGALVLVAAVALALLYVNVLRPVGEIMGDLRQLGDLSDMNALVTSTEPFVPPAAGELDPDQLDRFAQVQTAMRRALGPGYEELRRRSEQLRGIRRNEDGSFTKPGFRDVIRAFDGLGPQLREAKAAQVEALNQTGFSYAEYRWVREATYRALGEKNGDVYLEDFAESVLGLSGSQKDTVEARGVIPDPAELAAGDTARAEPIVPITVSDAPRNRILAAAFSDSVDAWRPFLVFGL